MVSTAFEVVAALVVSPVREVVAGLVLSISLEVVTGLVVSAVLEVVAGMLVAAALDVDAAMVLAIVVDGGRCDGSVNRSPSSRTSGRIAYSRGSDCTVVICCCQCSGGFSCRGCGGCRGSAGGGSFWFARCRSRCGGGCRSGCRGGSAGDCYVQLGKSDVTSKATTSDRK